VNHVPAPVATSARHQRIQRTRRLSALVVGILAGVGLAAARANGAEREAIPESCQTRQRLRIPLMRKKTAITCLPTLYRLRRLRCSRW